MTTFLRPRALAVLFGLVLSVSLPAASAAQDVLGLWFDADGTVDRATTTAPFEVVTGYLILKNPSRTTGVESWECVVEAETTDVRVCADALDPRDVLHFLHLHISGSHSWRGARCRCLHHVDACASPAMR